MITPTSRYYIRAADSFVRYATGVTVSTRFLQARYGGSYLPSAKDTATFDPSLYDADESRRWLGLSGNIVLMFPGTARHHKGLEDLLSAVEVLGNGDVRVVLVGGREVGEPVVRALEERYPRCVVRLGRYSSDEMPRVVAAAHSVVVPQRDEPVARAQFPITLTDGMAMEKPIISTNVGDIPEIVGDGGWIVTPGSVSELSGAIKELIADPAGAARRGAAARARCVERYSFDSVSGIMRDTILRWGNVRVSDS